MTRMIPLKIKDSGIVEIFSDTAVGLTYLHGHAHSHSERIRESQRMIVIPLRVGRNKDRFIIRRPLTLSVHESRIAYAKRGQAIRLGRTLMCSPLRPNPSASNVIRILASHF